jgi:hypothetical protein
MMAKFAVVWLTMWQPEHPILLNAWNPVCIDAADAVELLVADAADEVEVEDVEEPAAIGMTEAIMVEAVEVPADEDVGVVVDAVIEVAVDAGVVDAVDDVVKGTAGVGGASIRMNMAKLTMSELKSDAWLELSPPSAVGTVSSGKGAGEHSGEALEFRSLGNRSLVIPSSTL